MQTLTKKITSLCETSNITAKIQECYAVPGADNIVDVVRPETGKSWVNGETLDEIRLRYPSAEVVNFDEWCAAKARRQDSPLTWENTTGERYDEMLNVLPPAAQVNGAFLVGEAWDHHATSGKPRFQAFRCKPEFSHGGARIRAGSSYWASSRPMTHAEFCAMFGKCLFTYS